MKDKIFAPNPQFFRKKTVLLNGEWDFGYKKRTIKVDFCGDYSLAEKVRKAEKYPYKINVPFCPESELSGINYKGFISEVWYRKNVEITKGNGRVFLNIGAADYKTFVLVNGKGCCIHKGGYTPIRCDITDAVRDGNNEIFILCQDDVKSPLICRGKQSEWIKSHGCDYTRTTGIWQDVYLEYTPVSYIESFKIYTDYKNKTVTVFTKLNGSGKLCAKAFYGEKEIAFSELKTAENTTIIQLKLSEIHLWEIGNGRLYDLELKFGTDKVYSYFGLRDIGFDGMKFLLNSKSVFQRLVLDQGFYKKGIYTPENDEERLRDIKLSQSLGFNGARLHQKVFDPRFLYFCDREGYMVWGEYPNWGLDYSNPKAVDIFLAEWAEALKRDFNHPSIIGWCPFNETWDYHKRQQYSPLLSTVYDFTKAYDPTRVCIDTSGNFHVKTDIFDLHDYRFDPEEFKASYDRFVTHNELYQHVLLDNPDRQVYNGEPVFISEYGGIKLESDSEHKSWGYGVDVKTPEEYLERYKGLTLAILGNIKLFGFCYTQLYDIEQEQNGVFTYERKPKFSDDIYAKIKAANETAAEIEK